LVPTLAEFFGTEARLSPLPSPGSRSWEAEREAFMARDLLGVD
jgi:hypothetical protein